MRSLSLRHALHAASLGVSLTLVLAAAGCSDGTDSSSSSGTSGSGQTACERDTRKDTYAAGLSKKGATFTVKILDAQPAPPVKGTNVLTLQVSDAAGAPVNGATVTVVPFMPDHGHGSAVVPVVTALGADGKYTVEKLYLAMSGLWEIRVNVTAPGAAPTDVTFSFCLDG